MCMFTNDFDGDTLQDAGFLKSDHEHGLKNVQKYQILINIFTYI